MSKKILVSIIIPVYNGEKFIKKTINSCLNQTIRENIEVIIINDFSSDSSENIINEFGDSVRYFKNEVNKGIIYCVNRGLDIAVGDFIMFLGHDDLLVSEHIEIILEEFDEDTSFVFCDSSLIDLNDKVIKESSITVGVETMVQNPFYFLVRTNFINVCGLLFRREYALKVGKFGTQFRHYGEWDFWIKLKTLGKMKFSKKVKSFYRRHDTNITNKLMVEDMPKDLFQYYMSCRKLSFSNGNFSLKQSFYLRCLMLYFRLNFYKNHIYFKFVKILKKKYT